jgi:hypothetical protein
MLNKARVNSTTARSEERGNNRELRFPDFIGIGAQKAGTTWLYRMLEQHPDIWVPPLKEIHYFNTLYLDYPRDAKTGMTTLDKLRIERSLEMVDWVIRGRQPGIEKIRKIHSLSLIGLREITDHWYGRIFSQAPLTAVCGEITPEYALLADQGIRHMVALNSNLKIILLMRDPIERAWSDIRMPRQPFQTSFTEREYVMSNRFLERADYVGTLERYRRHVSGTNIFIGYLDDILERPLHFLEGLCAFLEVEFAAAMFANVTTPIHPGQLRELPPQTYDLLRQTLEPTYDRLLTLDHPVVRQWYCRHFGPSRASHGGVLE